MTPAGIQQTLQSGIAALKRGDKPAARTLLLQVVEADEANETAWLWLSATVESLSDQITALENVLALNPDNASAQKGLAQLRSQLPVQPFTPPEPEPPSAPWVLPPTTLIPPTPPSTESSQPTPIESVSALDDPYQCLYCGAPVARELKRCPECNRSLVVRSGNDKLSGSLRTAALVVMASIALAAVEALLVAVFHYQGDAFGAFVYDRVPAVNILAGDFRHWDSALTLMVLWVQFGLISILILTLLGLLYQVALAYYFSVGLMSINVLWMVYRWRMGFFGPLLAMVDIVCSIAALFFIFAAQPDFQVNLVRLRCSIDPHIKGGEALNRLGHIAKGKEQWALAVAYWRAATAAMPRQAGFYKDLAIGYAQIGYYQRALRTLEEFAHQAPDQSDYAPMKALIEQKRARDPHPRG